MEYARAFREQTRLPQCTVRGLFPGMSTLQEIEEAIEKLPPEQWLEIRRWMEHRAPIQPIGKQGDFDHWLAASTGIAKGRLTTDERMRETRGEY
jgi:hypothetical protein